MSYSIDQTLRKLDMILKGEWMQGASQTSEAGRVVGEGVLRERGRR